MKNVYAFIFARGGSKEIKNKNIKLFNGKPLIFYSIKVAKDLNIIKDVYVSSDSNKILKISKSFGAKTIKRPKNISQDNSPEIKAWKHAAAYLEKKNIKAEYFVSLPCTSPLRLKKDVILALKKIKKRKDFVIGITESNRNPYFNMLDFKKNKSLRPVIYEKNYHRRQNLKKVYDMTTIIYACHMSLVKNIKESIWETNIKSIKIPKKRSIDIDNLFDFRLAEYFYKSI